jgi:excisionase family DNA binding protein
VSRGPKKWDRRLEEMRATMRVTQREEDGAGVNAGQAARAAVVASELPLMLRIEAVAAQLSLHRATAYRLINQGAIKSCRIGKSRRVALQDLQAFIQSLREQSGADDEPPAA